MNSILVRGRMMSQTKLWAIKKKFMKNIYLYVRNFGAIDRAGLVELRRLTIFFGGNGNGKSTIQDALKTVHITNDKYLIYNARRASDVENPKHHQTDYFQRFNNPNFPKIGPTILGGYIEIIDPDDGNVQKTCTFGFGSDTEKKEHFYIEGINSRSDLEKIYKEAKT